MTIAEFLEARIAEHEERPESVGVYKAFRSILEDRKRIDRSANDDEWSMGYSDANYHAIQALASIYSAHDDYQQEWAK